MFMKHITNNWGQLFFNNGHWGKTVNGLIVHIDRYVKSKIYTLVSSLVLYFEKQLFIKCWKNRNWLNKNWWSKRTVYKLPIVIFKLQ